MKSFGEEALFGDVRYILTGKVEANGARVEIWTPIPEGLTAADLGRKFHAATWTLEGR